MYPSRAGKSVWLFSLWYLTPNFPKWLQNLWTRSHTDSTHQENLQTLDSLHTCSKYSHGWRAKRWGGGRGGHPNPELEFFALTSTFILCRHRNSYFAGFLFMIYKTAALGLRVKVIPLKRMCYLDFFPTWHTCQPCIRLSKTAIKR